MQRFYNMYCLSLARLLRSWYILGFLLLTAIPIILAIVIRANPSTMSWVNPKYPWTTSSSIDGEEPTSPNSPIGSDSNPPGNPQGNPPIGPDANPQGNPPANPPIGPDANPQGNPPVPAEENPEDPLKTMLGPKILERSLLDVFLALAYYFLIGSIMLLAMASLGSRLIANEVESGTLQLLFLRPLSRSTIYLAKYMALVTSGFIISSPAAIVLYLILCAGQYSIMVLFGTLFVLLLSLMAYSSVFLLMSMFKDGLYIALIYTIFWEIFIGFVSERVRNFSITHYVNSLYFQLIYPAEKLANATDMMSLSHALLTLLGITLFFLIVGLISFRQQEFNFC